MAGSAWATDYYVSAGGSGTTCTVGTECALSYAMTQADDDDTVHFLAGDYGTITPTLSGSSGHLVTYKIKAGEVEWSVHVGVGQSYGADLTSGQDYIKFEGLYFYNSSSRWIIAAGAVGNVWDTCRFWSSGTSTTGVYIYAASNYNTITNCTFDDAPAGTQQTKPDDMIGIYTSTGNVIEDSTFGKCAHNNITIWHDCTNSVVRNNTITQTYHTAIETNSIALISENTIITAGNDADNNPSDYESGKPCIGLALYGTGVIARNNIVHDSDIGIQWEWRTGAATTDHRQYHNTLYNNWWQLGLFGNNGGVYDGTIFKNNIIFDDGSITAHTAGGLTGNADYHIVGNYSDSPYTPANDFVQNMWTTGASSIYFKNRTTYPRTLDEVKVSDSTEWAASNFSGLAGLVNDDGIAGANDYRLGTGSIAIDAAAYLTTVSTVCVGVDDPHGDCTAANQLIVADGSYFYDGWGISGETADTIYDDDGSSALITDVTGNLITVDDTTGFTADDGITTVNWSDSAPDLGALERTESPPDEPPTTPADITFWWRCEAADFSGTNGTLDYSAGDDTAALTNATISADANLGTSPQANGLDCDSSSHYATFDGDILTSAEGRLYFKFSYNTWVNGAGLFFVDEDANNRWYIELTSDDGLKWYWKDDSTDRTTLVINDAGLSSSSTTYNIELAWNASTNYREVFVNGTSKGSSSDAINAITEATVQFGETYGGGGIDYYIDDIIITSDSAQDLYQFRNEPSYPSAAPVVADTYLCDCDDPWAEITDPTTYTQGQEACFAATSVEVFKLFDGEGIWSNVTYTLEGALIAGYKAGGESTKLIFSYTLNRGDDNADVDATSTAALSDGAGTIKNASAVEFVLTLPTADLGGIVTFDTSGDNVSVNFPGDYATWAAFETIYPNLVPNDRITYTAASENITLDADDDGTVGNQIILWMWPGYNDIIDLASNDYITVYAAPWAVAKITNSAGTGVVIKTVNGAAGL